MQSASPGQPKIYTLFAYLVCMRKLHPLGVNKIGCSSTALPSTTFKMPSSSFVFSERMNWRGSSSSERSVGKTT